MSFGLGVDLELKSLHECGNILPRVCSVFTEWADNLSPPPHLIKNKKALLDECTSREGEGTLEDAEETNQWGLVTGRCFVTWQPQQWPFCMLSAEDRMEPKVETFSAPTSG